MARIKLPSLGQWLNRMDPYSQMTFGFYVYGCAVLVFFVGYFVFLFNYGLDSIMSLNFSTALGGAIALSYYSWNLKNKNDSNKYTSGNITLQTQANGIEDLLVTFGDDFEPLLEKPDEKLFEYSWMLQEPAYSLKLKRTFEGIIFICDREAREVFRVVGGQLRKFNGSIWPGVAIRLGGTVVERVQDIGLDPSDPHIVGKIVVKVEWCPAYGEDTLKSIKRTPMTIGNNDVKDAVELELTRTGMELALDLRESEAHLQTMLDHEKPSDVEAAEQLDQLIKDINDIEGNRMWAWLDNFWVKVIGVGLVIVFIWWLHSQGYF